ncbi:DUF554 domain-containing protein [Jeotgalibaca sp. A122]|uniref:DUF554 domain-containing protein n=1 Tax=Jeotgalibaca sp. A122 TaxID=3457322 RepID=UPI003FD4F0AD
MILTGALVNGVAIIIGGIIGLALKSGLPERLGNALMSALGLCVLYIGISGLLSGDDMMVIILSMVFGTLIGEGFDLNQKINAFGNRLELKFAANSKDKTIPIAQGFVTASLIVCVGAMGIVGSMQSGLANDHSTLFAKALIDGIVCIVLASTLGIGVALSGFVIIAYEGSLAVFASFLAPLLTEGVINNLTSVGSLLIIALSLNMLKITDLKVMNFAPAVFMPILLSLFM